MRPWRWWASPWGLPGQDRCESRMGKEEKRDPRPGGQAAPELRAYLATLWRRKWGILAVLVVVVVTALFYSSRQTPLYESRAEVFVSPINFDPTQPSSAGGFINMLAE